MMVAHRLTWRAVRSSNWWRGALLLYVVLLAGCYELEPGVAILDVGNSRIPLAMHGVWVAPGGNHIRVIESKDGRVGQIYELEGTGSDRKIAAHRLFLAARADDHTYLVSGALGSISRQFVDVIKLDGSAFVSTERRAKQDQRSTDEIIITIDDGFRENLLLKNHRMEQIPPNETRRDSFTIGNGWGIRGDVSLQSIKAFVLDAMNANLFEIKGTWSRSGRARGSLATAQQSSWSAQDWAKFEALRTQFETTERLRQQRIDELLASTLLSDDAKRQLEALVKENVNVPQLESVGNAVRYAEFLRRVGGNQAFGDTSDAQAKLEEMLLIARTRDAALGHEASQLWLGQHHEALASKEGLNALNSALRWYELAASSGNTDGIEGAKRVLGKLSGLARQ